MSTEQLLTYYINTAHTSNQKQDYGAARELAQLAIAIAPSVPEAWYNLAIAEAGLGRFEQAGIALEQARVCALESAGAQNSIGLKFMELGNLASAETCFERALALFPTHVMARANLGQLRQLQGRLPEAEALLRAALDSEPDFAMLRVNLGSVLHEIGHYSEAEIVLKQAVVQDPKSQHAWKNLAVVYTSLGRDLDAVHCYQRVLELDPENSEAHWGLALLHIKSGDYENGWINFEHRWRVNALNLKPVRTMRPKWNGQRIPGTLLLWGEQGIGDQILFGSILPETLSLAERTVVALDRRLIPIFRRSMPELELVDLVHAGDQLKFDAQLPLGSLPLHFRKSADDFLAAHHPYLRADQDIARALRHRIARPGKSICGISWHSNRKQLGPHKSIHLRQLVSALETTQHHFVTLQYGDTKAERQSVMESEGIEVQSLEDVDCFNDIDGLASLIEACDVIVTVSNSTAHLAGALGKKTLLLLPWSEGRLWYWANHHGVNPWYPSIEMFAQQTMGDWSVPLRAVGLRLEQLRQPKD
ncbi:MAG: tetratricopeptide repeat protein [Burkholderiaceae bacterium]|jgi:Tfp pilus assembly protein PilF|nr:tetratricopeptide repeat protein [Burkholderiaceae bacterium]